MILQISMDGPAGASLVWSAFGNFKSSMLGTGVPGVANGAAAGLNGYVTGIPAGHSVASALTFSADGINGGMHSWGATLQQAFGTTKVSDPSSETLTYWTDNGAYYDFYAYEPVSEPMCMRSGLVCSLLYMPPSTPPPLLLPRSSSPT